LFLFALVISADAGNSQLSPREISEFQNRVVRVWNPRVGCGDLRKLAITVRLKLGRDGRLSAPPEIVQDDGQPRPRDYEAAASAAVRAIELAQPFDMFRAEAYDAWKDISLTFKGDMLHSEKPRDCAS
jgi:hypothetical protein